MEGLNEFGKYLIKHHINNIITTNYDSGIEFILCDRCGYIEQKPIDMVPERIYNIRTYKVFKDWETGHQVKLWKIHGDVNRIQSVTLGFDQYCGSIAKLTGYVKGTYKSTQKKGHVECKVPIEEKCRKQEFDQLSWAELFFRTNVYIVGFGMDFSELDIWWLLNKRARLMLEVSEINNTITYLYNAKYENEAEKADIYAALHAFQVSYRSFEADLDYIKRVFENMMP